MDDRKLTPQESMALITEMIQNTKQRIAMPDLRISIMWATVSIATAIVVMLLIYTIKAPWVNIFWMAIPVIGLPLTYILSRNEKSVKPAKSIIDRISDRVWRSVGFISITLMCICFVFSLMGYNRVWLIMFFFAFIILGFATAFQGFIIKEASYMFGGLFSVISGFVLCAMAVCGIPILISWSIPLFILCYLLMFIVTAIIIRRKLNKSAR